MEKTGRRPLAKGSLDLGLHAQMVARHGGDAMMLDIVQRVASVAALIEDDDLIVVAQRLPEFAIAVDAEAVAMRQQQARPGRDWDTDAGRCARRRRKLKCDALARRPQSLARST